MKFFFAIFLMICHAFAGGDWQATPQQYALSFPKDHGSHPEQKIEWWYFTGNLAAADGHAFGYQLTFFRIGTDPHPLNPSAWTVRDLHMAHCSISDLSGEKYYHQQRLERAGPGLAGAALDKLATWSGAWRAQMNDAQEITLQAETPEFQLKLSLDAHQTPLPHGEQGYSRKGSQPHNASIYYSLTRLPTRGTLTIGTTPFAVDGLSWMDHEFGSSFLEPGQLGWDWFSLQLEDGSDLMLFQIRQLAGAPTLSGTLRLPDGSIRLLSSEHFKLQSSAPWKSPATGALYPLKWKIALPLEQLDLNVSTPLPEQEMLSATTGPSYWEGAVIAAGTRQGQPIHGRGYLEMTGYAGQNMRSFFHLGE